MPLLAMLLSMPAATMPWVGVELVVLHSQAGVLGGHIARLIHGVVVGITDNTGGDITGHLRRPVPRHGLRHTGPAGPHVAGSGGHRR